MAFAFTSERVILVHLKSRKKRGIFIGEIRYSDLKEISSSFLGNLVLKFKNSQTLLFSKVPKKDRKHLKSFLGSVLGDSAHVKDKQGKSLIHMCPKCFTTMSQLHPTCPSCALAFKRPLTAGFLSLLMPGLGDIYLGSLVLGCFELLIMSLIWLGFLAGMTDVEITGGDQTGYIFANLIFLGVIHTLDGIKSSYMGRKGLYPKQKIRHEGES